VSSRSEVELAPRGDVIVCSKPQIEVVVRVFFHVSNAALMVYQYFGRHSSRHGVVSASIPDLRYCSTGKQHPLWNSRMMIRIL